MDEQRYWFLAEGYEDTEAEEGTKAEVAISVPWWPEAEHREYGEGREHLEPPVLYTTKERAERNLRRHQDAAPDRDLNLVERYGEEVANKAFNNTPPLRVFEMSTDLLLIKLEYSDFLCVLVDDKLRLRQDLIDELNARTS